MKRRTQQCIAAFVITGIILLGMCGFVAVDLSTDRYMPGQFVPLFQVTATEDEGLVLAFLGTEYRFDSTVLDPVREQIWEHRGLLPRSITVAANLVVQSSKLARDYRDSTLQPEEPW